MGVGSHLMDTTPKDPGIKAMCLHACPQKTSQSYSNLRHCKKCTPKAVQVFLTTSFTFQPCQSSQDDCNCKIIEKRQLIILCERITYVWPLTLLPFSRVEQLTEQYTMSL